MSAPSILDLFCGIGGATAAVAPRLPVVAGVDQNRRALTVYRHNFGHPVMAKTAESIPGSLWHQWSELLWWMSPPCQPYTRRGLQRDLDDPRATGLLAVIARIAQVRPWAVALENVPGFAGSRGHGRLREVLAQGGYHVRETVICPTELGLPNRRRRFYLVACRDQLGAWPARDGAVRRLQDCLDAQPAPDLWCGPETIARYDRALNIVDAEDADAATACFTAAYGRSPVRSGSYLRTPSGIRRFSPGEILRMLDFPADYRLPAHLARGAAWPLVGNSVCVRAVRWVLSAVPGVAQHALEQ